MGTNMRDGDGFSGGFRCDVIPAREGVTVVPIGELDVATAGELEETLTELSDAGFLNLILDLKRLTFIDSTGIRVVVHARERLSGDGRQFIVLPGKSVQVRRALAVTGLDELLFASNGNLS